MKSNAETPTIPTATDNATESALTCDDEKKSVSDTACDASADCAILKRMLAGELSEDDLEHIEWR